jgi:beta-N-acetylhexosaminidase
LICNSPDKADQLLAGLQPAAMAAESMRRIVALVPQMPALSWSALQEDVRYQAAKQTAEALAAE